jgi:hypothetical protein
MHQREADRHLGVAEGVIVANLFGDFQGFIDLAHRCLIGDESPTGDQWNVLVRDDENVRQRIGRAGHRNGSIEVFPPARMAQKASGQPTQCRHRVAS